MNINDYANAKLIKGFPGYAVTSCGKVLSLPRTVKTVNPITRKPQEYKIKKVKVLKTNLNHRGQSKVYLSLNGHKKTIYLRNLVAEYFLQKPKDNKNYVIWHLDENKQNNAANNLQYIEFKALCLLLNSTEYKKKKRLGVIQD